MTKVWEAKDEKFEEIKKTGKWDTKQCPACAKRSGHCCKSWSHHTNNNCLHCGNDERDN